MVHPIEAFREWYSEQLTRSASLIPTACCLSTIGLDGYPNARFVSLKEVRADAFIITGPVDSRKGRELQQIPHAALTFWWPETERHVRIQGMAERISDADADRYFADRERDTQIISLVSRQGYLVEDEDAVKQRIRDAEKLYAHKPVPRPQNWGGFAIQPVRIELMAFRPSRFHERRMFEKVGDEWVCTQLQP
ncbi:MAG TPA: pyridoxal 5'-phosphate synthase [Patescibacteria group bacterium]|nr:pyridoxal 5'-phosphate synthase [Patescibacteria group bacterium]